MTICMMDEDPTRDREFGNRNLVGIRGKKCDYLVIPTEVPRFIVKN